MAAFPTFTPVNTFNQGQVNNAQSNYGTQQQSALQANQALKDYTNNLQDPSQMYSQNLGQTEGQLGFDPKQMLAANQQLAVTQNQMANLPQSIAQQGGGYGVTAGQMANNYTQAAGNLHTALADQGNNLNALQSTYSNALNQAGQQTSFGVQGQQMKLGALQNVYSNAAQQQQTSLQNMQFLEQQFQQQGEWNSDQARQYATSYAQYQQAMASASAASAQAELFRQQAQQMPNLNSMISNYLGQQQNVGKAQQPAAPAPSPQSNPVAGMPFLSGGFAQFANGVGTDIGKGVLGMLGL